MGRVQRAKPYGRKHGQEELTEAEKHDAYMGRKVRGRVTGTPSKTLPVIGKLLKKDVLYLIIVNLPSEEEIREIGERLKRRRGRVCRSMLMVAVSALSKVLHPFSLRVL